MTRRSAMLLALLLGLPTGATACAHKPHKVLMENKALTDAQARAQFPQDHRLCSARPQNQYQDCMARLGWKPVAFRNTKTRQ
jgi:hypothetical protein